MPQFNRTDPPEIILTGLDVEPPDASWGTASRVQREAYFRQLAVFMRDGLYRQLRKGIGADGRRMPPRRRKRSDGATGPVLSPHWSDSRFRTQLRHEGTGRMARLYWLEPWASIVTYHAEGKVKGAPVRNVVGLTEAEEAAAVKKARAWYAGQNWTGTGVSVSMIPGQRERVERAAAGFERIRPLLGLPDLPPAPIRVPAQPVLPPLPRVVLAPPLPKYLPAVELTQRVRVVYEAAGRAEVSDLALAQTLVKLEGVPTRKLREIALRLGIEPVPIERDRILDLLRETLEGRLAEARRLYRGAS